MANHQSCLNTCLLNLACGSKISSVGNWVNVDFSSPIDDVIEMNILDGLSFPEDSFDVVYTAQFIEHLTLQEAISVLREVYRVLKPGGILRIVTPDMEELARTYLHYLDRLKHDGSSGDAGKYDWIRIEIFDQIVRDHSGGEMKGFIEHCDSNMKAYISKRIGYTFTSFSAAKLPNKKRALLLKLKKTLKKILQLITAQTDTEIMKIGRFRLSGEVHRYMHDVYSLERLLHACQFSSIERVSPYASSISDWDSYELDVIQGQVDAPYSLYMEAKKI